MNFNKLLLGAIGVIALQSGALIGVDQTLNYTVPAVSSLTLSGDVTFPEFATPAPGENFAPVTDSSSSYSLSANSSGGANSTISAKLSAAAPSGLEVAVTLAAPTGATSASETTLSTSDQTLVSEIGSGSSLDQAITYSIKADLASTPPGASTVVVTYTLVGAQ